MQADVKDEMTARVTNIIGPAGKRVQRHDPFVYQLTDGKVFVDFHVETRFTVEEWVELVDKVNDRLFHLLMEDHRSKNGREGV